MKNLFKYTLPVVALCTLAACSDKDDITNVAPKTVDPNEGKELIALSGEGTTLTRASLTRAGFTAVTKVVIRMKAEDKDGSGVRYTQAVATAGKQTTTDDDCNATEYLGSGYTHSHLSYNATQYRYWDDAFGRKTKLTVLAVAVPDKNDDTILPDDKLSTNGTGQTNVSPTVSPHWYTITGDENTTIDWSVSATQTSETRSKEDIVYSNNIQKYSNTEEESLTSGQITAAQYKGRYHQSWNGSTWTKSMLPGRMLWQEETSGSTTGKFDQGHLVFKHALSWITVVLKEFTDVPGDNKYGGFSNSSNSDFAWTKNGAAATQNITLTGFPTTGKLNIATGEWSDPDQRSITQMEEQTTDGKTANVTVRTLHAYVLPGTNLYGTSTGEYGNTNVIEFEIDKSKYYVKGSQIAEAIRDYNYGSEESPDKKYADFTTIEAGKHYFINLTVTKKAIDNITAAVIDWETVNSNDATPENTYCTFELEDRGTKLVEADAAEFNIYRSAQSAQSYIDGATAPNYKWQTGYASGGAATKSWTTDHWKTRWFWENNLTYYHFRAAGIFNGTATGTPTDPSIVTAENDNFVIHSGALTGSSYKDYIWGAPFKELDSPTANANTAKLTYSTTSGFDNTTGTAPNETHQISQAIGATKSTIHMLLFHMTSQITVNIFTTTDASEVELKNDAATSPNPTLTTVEIVNFLPNGTVLMGNGLVESTTTDSRNTDRMTSGNYTAKSGAGTVESPYVAAKVAGYTYGIVPQALSWSSGTIGLRITTPDGNKYEVKDLSDCWTTLDNTHLTTNNLTNPYTETKSVESTTYYKIDRWYPGYKYVYDITIKKTGIENVTAAVVDWEEVHAVITNPITLEN